VQAQASKPTTSSSQDTIQTSKTIEDRVAILEKEILELRSKINFLMGKINSQSPSSVSDNSSNTTTPPKNKKPSDDEIKSALVEKFRKDVPATWAGSLMGGKNGVLSSIEILQIGNYNDQYRYWPMKIRVKGTCDADFIMKTEKRSFDKTGDFKIKQDDYGKWTAELEGF
jgi:uncharacterized coiled-coil protein SlyX